MAAETPRPRCAGQRRENGVKSPPPLISDPEFQEARLADDSCVVKVRFTFTFVVIVPRGCSYATLARTVGEKLSVPAETVALR